MPPGLLDSLIGLQIYINSIWQALIEPREKVRVVETVTTIVDRFKRFYPDSKINFSSQHLEECEIPVANGPFESLLIELIQNALTHSPEGETVDIYMADNEIYILNTIRDDENLHFRIMNNIVIEGHIPKKSTSVSGSGKGLRKGLETAQKLRLLLSMEMDGPYSPVKTCIDFSQLVKPAGPAEEAVMENPAQELGNVLFMCHQNTPESTFRGVGQLAVPGFKYSFVHPPKSLNNFGRFLVENANLFKQTCLCVVHMTGKEFETILRPMHAQFPHILFLPANAGDTFIPILFNRLDDHAYEMEHHGKDREYPEMERVLTAEGMAKDGGEALGNLVSGRLYRKSYKSDVWEAILKHAHERASELAKAQAATVE